MINRNNTSSITPAGPVIGILMDNELLLLEAVQGKRVLRSLLLPTDVSEPGRLLQYLWDAGLDSAWVMPATTLSRSATCSWLEQASRRWVVRVHPIHKSQPDRPVLSSCQGIEGSGKRVAWYSPSPSTPGGAGNLQTRGVCSPPSATWIRC